MELVRDTHAEVGLLQHVQQARHRPAARDLTFERGEGHRLRLWGEWRKDDAALSPVDDSDGGIPREGRIELFERADHRPFEPRDERVCARRLGSRPRSTRAA